MFYLQQQKENAMEEKEDEQGNMINNAEDVDPTKVPQSVIKEKDDQPAANNMKRTIIIAIVLLLIIYLVYNLIMKGQ